MYSPSHVKRELTRANTFVEAKGDFDGFKPLKRAGTFALGSSRNTKDQEGSEMTFPINFNDMKFRRHFGAEPSLVKASSLNVKGMKYVMDEEEKREQDERFGSGPSLQKGGLVVRPPRAPSMGGAAGDVVVVVDTFTTGAMLAHRLR